MSVQQVLFAPRVGRRLRVCSALVTALERAEVDGRSVPLRDAVELAVDHAGAVGMFQPLAFERYQLLWRRFEKFALRSTGATTVGDVSPVVVRLFVDALTLTGQPPATSTRRLRLSAVGSLFRILRSLRIAADDPTLDILLPGRTRGDVRPLTDLEVERCRWNAVGTTATRRPAVWALAESGVTTAEVAIVRVGDLLRDQPVLRIPGLPNATPRDLPLEPWADTQLRRRSRDLGGDPAALLAVERPGPIHVRRTSATAMITAILRASGLGPDPQVRPRSVSAWVGRRVLAETGRIDAVARRLGLSSLDRAAELIGWDWTDQP